MKKAFVLICSALRLSLPIISSTNHTPYLKP